MRRAFCISRKVWYAGLDNVCFEATSPGFKGVTGRGFTGQGGWLNRELPVSTFERVLQKARGIDSAQWAQKHLTGWGSDCAISGIRQTEDAACNWNKTGVMYSKGAYPEGHDHHRRGFMERTIVIAVDERRYRNRVDQAAHDWLFGRECSCCKKVQPLDSHHWHRHDGGLCGFHRVCKSCRNRGYHQYYQDRKRGQFQNSFT